MYIHYPCSLVEFYLGASFRRLHTTLSFTGLWQWILEPLEEVYWRQALRDLLDQGHVEARNRMSISVWIFLKTALEVGVRGERHNDAQEAELSSIIAPVGQRQKVPGSVLHEAGMARQGAPFTFL